MRTTFYKVDSRVVNCIKVKCIDSIPPPEIVFGREVNALRAEILNLFEQITNEGRVPIPKCAAPSGGRIASYGSGLILLHFPENGGSDTAISARESRERSLGGVPR